MDGWMEGGSRPSKPNQDSNHYSIHRQMRGGPQRADLGEPSLQGLGRLIRVAGEVKVRALFGGAPLRPERGFPPECGAQPAASGQSRARRTVASEGLPVCIMFALRACGRQRRPSGS